MVDNKREGAGILCDQNGNIRYKGDWVNDQREGFGKYNYENGDYYEGQWKNGLENGFGKLYNENGNIKYKGDWVNGKREGFGK